MDQISHQACFQLKIYKIDLFPSIFLFSLGNNFFTFSLSDKTSYEKKVQITFDNSIRIADFSFDLSTAFFSYCGCYASQPAIRLLSLLALLLDSPFFVTICTDFAEIPVN
jgi:hypothetical protein